MARAGPNPPIALVVQVSFSALKEATCGPIKTVSIDRFELTFRG
jgi:hypothetical protein